MSDRAGLLRGILDAPDDDTPRLVMADWFEENGSPERGEFIRLQCAIARADPADRDRLVPLAARERALWEANAPAWRAELPAWARLKAAFRRGFPSSLSATPAQWLKARGVARQAPLDALHLDRADPGRLAAVAAADHLATIRVLRPSLDYSLEQVAERLAVLGRSPHLGRLRVLSLYRGGGSIGSTRGDVVARTLAELPGLPSLESLSLSHCEVGPHGLAALVRSPLAARLRALDLAQCPVGPDGARILAESPSLAGLRALDLTETNITDAGVEALAGSPHLANLTHLNLRMSYLSGASARAVARSPYLRRLTSLSFHFGHVGPGGGIELAGSPNLAGVVYLNLFGNGIGDAGARALADSPHLSRLRVLELGGNALTEAGMRALMGSRAFPNLERASFWNTAAAADLEEQLPSLPNLPRLREVWYYPIVSDSIARRDAEEPFGPLHGEALLRRVE